MYQLVYEMLVKGKNADNNFQESTMKSSDTIAYFSPLGSENNDKKAANHQHGRNRKPHTISYFRSTANR